MGQLHCKYFGFLGKIKIFFIHFFNLPKQGKESAKKGAPSYMAPELFQDDGVYSF